jgi:hypothetical protein
MRIKLTYTFLGLFMASFLLAQPAAPSGFSASGYDSHVELRWQPNTESNISYYRIYRADGEGQPFQTIKNVSANQRWHIDFRGYVPTGTQQLYRITAFNTASQESAPSAVIAAATTPMNDEELMDMVQRYTFRYFWDFGHPVSGMARERNTSGDIVTTGGTGFGIMAILVGVERGYITREQGLQRLIQISTFLQLVADRFHGAFPHWMNGNSGDVVPFSQFDNGGDLVETAFLIQGLLAARQYFNQNVPLENSLRNVITDIWEDVEWDWYRKNNSNVLYWHWSPNYNWQMNFPLRGFNEVMITYLLAVASPTHGVPASLYQSGWIAPGYVNGQTYYGYKLDVGPYKGGPLFFAHYSFLGFDPRNKRDAYTNYFTRNRNHTLINRAYCIENPENHQGYSADSWGLTASDNPWGYSAHEATLNSDNGTITPTAALSSMPYTPGVSMEALRHFYRNLGDRLWGYHGFYDAFNLDQNWFASSYLAIDQGPIIGMIENHRSGLLWNLFMANPEIQQAVTAVGFVEDVTATTEATSSASLNLSVFPNPARTQFTLGFQLTERTAVSATLKDLHGKTIASLFGPEEMAPGDYSLQFPLSVSSGVYILHLSAGATRMAKKILVLE